MAHIIWTIREILFRKWLFLLLLLGPTVLVAISACSLIITRQYEADAQHRLKEKEILLTKQMDHLWDEYRKMTKDLGFNVLILPKNQNLADFYADNFASEFMSETYADTLAQSKTIIIEHILPALFMKTFWSEKKRSIFVCGTRGELTRNTSMSTSNNLTAIMEAVPEGTIVCGAEIVQSCSLREGQTVNILGKSFTISKCLKQRGNRDDITVWMPLPAAQQLFKKEGLINAIFALECRCAADENLANLAKIRVVLQKLLPETQVIEFMSEVIDRAEVRFAAIKVQQNALDQEKSYVLKQHQTRTGFVTGLLTTVFSASTILISLLTFLNVRERLYEIGILRAIGFKGTFILLLFSFKLFITGLIGSIIGLAIGHIVIILIANKYLTTSEIPFSISVLVCLITGGTFVTLLSGIPPIMYGITRNPAALLRGTV
jgi:putative ABC transport system permease protein